MNANTKVKTKPKAKASGAKISAPKSVAAAKTKEPVAKTNLKSKGRYDEGDVLPPEVEALSTEDRPLVWRDLADFRARHNRTIADIVYDLALQVGKAYSPDSSNRKILPFDMEMLVRLYDASPSSCNWKRPTILGMFRRLYGEAIDAFSEELRPAAELAYGRRYARSIGRLDTALYRWKTGSKGDSTIRRMGNLLSKIESLGETDDEIREKYEALAFRAWMLRGVDINKDFPIPSEDSVRRPPGSRGRKISITTKAAPKVATYTGGAFF